MNGQKPLPIPLSVTAVVDGKRRAVDTGCPFVTSHEPRFTIRALRAFCFLVPSVPWSLPVKTPIFKITLSAAP